MNQFAFDDYAISYDLYFEENNITKILRKKIQTIFLSYFKKEDLILELNCGTGNDAIFLAQNGINIFATDISQKMIEVTSEKILKLNLENNITLEQKSIENIFELQTKNFDGIFSNFGGINCVTNISNVFYDVNNLLKPNGIFILNYMNKFCLFETIAFLKKGKLKKAFERLHKNGVDVKLQNEYVKTYYYFANQIKQNSQKYFDIIQLTGLNFFSPNPNFIDFYNRHPKISNIFLNIENKVESIFPFYYFGDHAIVVLKKKKI